jgi:predicted transcriptional regulator of viral defense system
MEDVKQLKLLFKEKNGILSFQELESIGLNQYSIKKLIGNGIIERIKRGKYIYHEFEENEYLFIQQMVPLGIICLISAATIYNYTTHIPNKYHVAIKSNYYPRLPNYPPIKIYYWRKKQYELGMKTIRVNGVNLRIYDKEKTVCDFLKFRKKLDFNIVKEVLKAYLKDEEKNLIKLKRYSKELRIESILNNYLEILL